MTAQKKIKLTPAQLELLKEERGTFVEGYKPGMKLIELKLIDAQEAKYGQYKWTINDAGRDVLAL